MWVLEVYEKALQERQKPKEIFARLAEEIRFQNVVLLLHIIPSSKPENSDFFANILGWTASSMPLSTYRADRGRALRLLHNEESHTALEKEIFEALPEIVSSLDCGKAIRQKLQETVRIADASLSKKLKLYLHEQPLPPDDESLSCDAPFIAEDVLSRLDSKDIVDCILDRSNASEKRILLNILAYPDHTHAERSRRLGMSASAIRVHLHRLRKSWMEKK